MIAATGTNASSAMFGLQSIMVIGNVILSVKSVIPEYLEDGNGV